MRYKIKYNEYNVFNKINFYQLHGKLIPTVFNKKKFTREDVNRNNESEDYEIMSD